jgi:hypothetical protein
LRQRLLTEQRCSEACFSDERHALVTFGLIPARFKSRSARLKFFAILGSTYLFAWQGESSTDFALPVLPSQGPQPLLRAGRLAFTIAGRLSTLEPLLA